MINFNNILRYLPFLLIAITFIVMTILSVNTTSFEEIELYQFFHKVFDGTASWKDWFAPQSNHRIFINRVLYFINLYLGGQIFTINVLSFIMVIFSARLFSKIINCSYPDYLFFIFVTFMFSWFQHETFVHAHTINYNQEILCSALLLYGLKRNKPLFVHSSLVLSMFTMLSWVILIPIVLFECFYFKQRKYIPLCLLSIIGLFLYRDAPQMDHQFLGLTTDLGKLIPFFFSLLGSLFGPLDHTYKFVIGGLILFGSLFAFIKGDKWNRYLIFWGIMHFIMISLGRCKYTLNGANLYRYVSYGSVLYATLFSFVTFYLLKKITLKKSLMIISVLLVFFTLSFTMTWFNSSNYRKFKMNGLNCVNKSLTQKKVAECHPYPIFIRDDYKEMYDFYKTTQDLGFATPGILDLD